MFRSPFSHANFRRMKFKECTSLLARTRRVQVIMCIRMYDILYTLRSTTISTPCSWAYWVARFIVLHSPFLAIHVQSSYSQPEFSTRMGDIFGASDITKSVSLLLFGVLDPRCQRALPSCQVPIHQGATRICREPAILLLTLTVIMEYFENTKDP
jgi:hypothetical protein